MLLAVDVGNTNVTLALFDGDRLAADWRVTSHRERTADEMAVELRQLFELRGFDLDAVTGVVISSVVPTLNPALVEASRRYLKCEPVMVGPGAKTIVRIRYDSPKDVGADRIANALAAYSKYGGPVVVIDFGTAVTYDAINAEGDYLGGAIAPGVEISLDALISHTAMLRRVEPVAPDTVIGRNTITSIQSGLVWGFVAQVEGMVKRMVGELGGSARVVATGGLEGLPLDDPSSIGDRALILLARGDRAPAGFKGMVLTPAADASASTLRELMRVAIENVILKHAVGQLEEQTRRLHRQFE